MTNKPFGIDLRNWIVVSQFVSFHSFLIWLAWCGNKIIIVPFLYKFHEELLFLEADTLSIVVVSDLKLYKLY